MFGERHYVRSEMGFDRPGKNMIRSMKVRSDLRPEGLLRAFDTAHGTDGYEHPRKVPTKAPHPSLKYEMAKSIAHHIA